jgi:PAS domain S-box-containing protein
VRIPLERTTDVRVAGQRDVRRPAVQILALAGVYAIVGRLGLAIAPVHFFATLVWPPTGVALAVLLRGGLHLWPGVTLGAFVVNAWRGAPAPLALALSVGNTLEAVLGAWLIRRAAGQAAPLERLRGVLAFIVLGALLSTAVSASVGVSSLLAADLLPRPDAPVTWLVWWLGDVAGALVIGSLLLAWSAKGSPADARRRAEAAALGAVSIAATAFVFFHRPVAAPTGFLQACLLIPLLMWTAVRFGVRGATAAILLASATAVAGTAQGLGPFAHEPLPGSLLHQQAFTAILAASALIVGAVTAGRAAALAALRDATEAEHRSLGMLRTLADSIPDPVFVKDEQSRMLFANPATLQAIGKPAQDVLGRSDREFFDDAGTGAAIVENDRRILAAGEAMTVEERIESPGGHRWFLSTKAPFRDAAGRFTGLIGVTRDITERKRAEEALRESEERFRAFVTASSDVVYRVSPDWSEMRELRGREFVADTDAPSRGWLEKYIHPDDQPRVTAAIHEAIRTRSVFQLEHRVLRVDGSLGWTFSRAVPLLDANGGLLEWLGAAIDITARKQAEEALRESEAALQEADRQKNRFLAMLSHELRNPLAPIRNGLYILERAAPGGEQARRAQAILHRQIGQMTWLIDDLLDVTRIAHGKITLRRERLELDELAHRAVEDHQAIFAKSGVRLEALPAPAEVPVDGDRVRLAQVISNLLQNAAKFTPRGGKTTVSVESNPVRGQAILTVRDTGSGIQREMLPRLFDAFTQADTTLDRSKGGLGLGLALVKGLVEMHGGSVSAASDGLGKGAAFTITLPLEVAAAGVVGARPDRGVTAVPSRVLVIEDNEDAADSLREVLELGGHIVEVAYSGRDGIEMARAFHPDVVLCDIGLPEMDGYEVARTIRADPGLGRVALVAVSGYAQPEDVATASEAGFDAHLAKPPSIETLERVLAGFGSTRREDRPDPS